VRGGYKDVRHEANQSSQGFAWFHRGDDNSEQTSSGTGHSIRPATAMPRSVLVSDMGEGSLLLKAWREGPSAYLSPADAVPLSRALAAAFSSPDLTPSGNQGRAR
jgi:hypothetical protein